MNPLAIAMIAEVLSADAEHLGYEADGCYDELRRLQLSEESSRLGEMADHAAKAAGPRALEASWRYIRGGSYVAAEREAR